MRAFVTGGSGFLGRVVVGSMLGAGDEVVALARSDETERTLRNLGAETARGDLDDPRSITDAVAGANAPVLVNVASLGFGHAPTVVEAATLAGVQRAVFVSTTAIFTSLPAPSKAMRIAAEDTIRASTLDWAIARPTMIYGAPGDRNMERLLRVLTRAPVIPVPGGGARLLQPVHVEDLADAVVTLARHTEHAPAAYDLAGPTALSLCDTILVAAQAVGRQPLLLPVPLRPTLRLVRAYERMARHPRLKAEQIERLAEDKAFDIGPARRDLGFDPRTFADGIRQEATALDLAPGSHERDREGSPS